MLVTGVEINKEFPTSEFHDVDLREPSIFKIVFVMAACICSLAIAAYLLLITLQKATTVYVKSRKSVRAPHPYYYSIISG